MKYTIVYLLRTEHAINYKHTTVAARYLMFRQRRCAATMSCHRRHRYLLLDACAGDSSLASVYVSYGITHVRNISVCNNKKQNCFVCVHRTIFLEYSGDAAARRTGFD